MAVLTGPLILAKQLSGIDLGGAEPDARGGATLEYAGRFVLEGARQFLLAGAHLVMFLEEQMPQPSLSDAWRAAVLPVGNMARFHKALIAVLPLQIENVPGFLELLPKGCLACLPSACAAPEMRQHTIGMAFPPHPLSWSKPETMTVSLLTTCGEVPPLTDIGELRAACERMRG